MDWSNQTRNWIGVGLITGIAVAAPPPTLAEAGLRSSNSDSILTTLEIPQQRVVSDRGADFLAPLGLKSSFISTTTSPAEGLRVRVWNMTQGFSGEEAPFTERDYSSEAGADAFVVVPDAQHRTRWFSVLSGSDAAPKQNDFRYEIVDTQDTVVESGEFSVAIALNPDPITTTFRFGSDYRYSYYPTENPSLGLATGRGSRHGFYFNEREFFKARQQFKRDNSDLFRLRDR